MMGNVTSLGVLVRDPLVDPFNIGVFSCGKSNHNPTCLEWICDLH